MQSMYFLTKLPSQQLPVLRVRVFVLPELMGHIYLIFVRMLTCYNNLKF